MPDSPKTCGTYLCILYSQAKPKHPLAQASFRIWDKPLDDLAQLPDAWDKCREFWRLVLATQVILELFHELSSSQESLVKFFLSIPRYFGNIFFKKLLRVA